jgi:AcrR family transcriptional regulator
LLTVAKPTATPTRAAGAGKRRYRGATEEERRADQRRRLLSAAAEVFSRRGFASASVDEIVSRARTSRTAFYRCFENKEECLTALHAATVERWAANLGRAVSEADSPAARVRAGIASLVFDFANGEEAARVVLVESVGATPALEEARIEARARFAKLIADQLAQVPGWKERTPSERQLVAVATMGAVAEAATHGLVAGSLQRERRKVVEQLTAYALRALTPPGG